MARSVFALLKEKAGDAARKMGLPSFYHTHRRELDISYSAYCRNKLVRKCRSYLDESTLHPAHGIFHCEKVAIEAGAVLQIECSAKGINVAGHEELMFCVHMAGLLHDIKRAEAEHTIKGSQEAAKILCDFDVDDRFKRYIIAAIRNHEAFKGVIDSEDADAKLISDSLYDADKFRWGPDNFTTTLWLIIESGQTSVRTLYCDFQEKMEGIKKIKETFRTATGKRYGPEFIDYGIRIGDSIYHELKRVIGDQQCS